MNTEAIKRIVDDEQVERLTAQLCRHWDVATERLEELVQDLNEEMDTCAEAEIYAAIMRMQSCAMALMELNKMPCAFLFSEYLERIGQTVSNTSIRQSVMALMERLMGEKPVKSQVSFFETITQLLAQHAALPIEQQEAIRQKTSPLPLIVSLCAQYLKPEDLLMVAPVFQNMTTESDDQAEIAKHIADMRQAMGDLADKMGDSRQMMLIWLVILMLLPTMIVGLLQRSRTDSPSMARLFNKGSRARARE